MRFTTVTQPRQVNDICVSVRTLTDLQLGMTMVELHVAETLFTQRRLQVGVDVVVADILYDHFVVIRTVVSE